jgi:hypothetical protein
MVICPNCNTPNPPINLLCFKCGTPLRLSVPHEPANPPTDPKPADPKPADPQPADPPTQPNLERPPRTDFPIGPTPAATVPGSAGADAGGKSTLTFHIGKMRSGGSESTLTFRIGRMRITPTKAAAIGVLTFTIVGAITYVAVKPSSSHTNPPTVNLSSGTHHFMVRSAAGTVVAKYNDQSGSGHSSKGSGTSTTRYTCCAGGTAQANGLLSGASGNSGSIGSSDSQMTFGGSATNSDLQCTVTYPQSSPAPSDLPSISTTVQGSNVHAVWSVLPIEVGGIGGPRNCPFLATLNIPYDEENRLFGKDYPLSTFAQSAPFTISITAHYTDKAWDVTWDLTMTVQRVD